MRKCDVCGKQTKELVELADKYKSDDIQEICKDCDNYFFDITLKVNSLLSKEKVSWIRRLIKRKRNENN